MRRFFDIIIKGGAGLLLLFCITVKAQVNLVLNPSFVHGGKLCGDFNYGCTGSNISFWISPTYGTPDWFDNPCKGMPQNYAGYQFPMIDNQYAGFAIENRNSFNAPDAFEYLEGQLTSGLLNGKKYCVTYFVSLSDSSWYATSTLGAYLSSAQICASVSLDTLPYHPQVLNSIFNLLSDKVNWVPVSGEYKAAGGEQYITIGSFDSITPYTYVGNGGMAWSVSGAGGQVCYYYIDNVSVREIIFAHAGKDTEICNGGKALIGNDTASIGGSYQWSPTTGLATPNSPQTVASPTITTTYTLTVVNDSMKGCNCPDSVNTDTVTVFVCPQPELPDNIFIPDAFSPNKDGQNDMLFAKGNNIATFYIIIYDRWGNKVFETHDINTGWDGVYGSKPEDAGTFVYYVSGTYADGNTFNKKGNIELVR